ncbi:MAG TPA: peptidylprolyl isomerase [Fibrobacteria bacterium]|nr:peptidylprolyl isomerase [Fibrobacteria bacterium]
MILHALIASALASAGLPPPDGVAALVADQPILVSDVAEAVRYQVSVNPALAKITPAARCERVLEQLIEDKILFVRAKAESLEVSESEASQRVEQKIAEMTERAGGMESFSKVLKDKAGLTLGQYRFRLAKQVREERMKEKLRDKYVSRSEPAREEVLAFFREYKDSMPMLPDQVKLSQITIKVAADSTRDREAFRKAQETIERLRKGADFAQLAKELSQDPGSKNQGGDIGFMKRGELDPAYEKAALALESGRYTQIPVRSRFGWHVIELQSRRDQEFRTRHILFALLPDSKDSAHAKEIADSLRRVANAGGDFAAMARVWSSEKASASFGGVLGWYPEGELQGQFRDLIAGIATGKVGEPVPTPEGLLLVRVDERLQSRKLSPEEDWTRLSQLAAQNLSNRRLMVWVERWKAQVPVDRRMKPSELATKVGL